MKSTLEVYRKTEACFGTTTAQNFPLTEVEKMNSEKGMDYA